VIPPWPPGLGRQVLDSTDSTMAEAARQAESLVVPTWIMARRQTAARGRRGRPWAMPPGNFAASIVLRPTEPPAEVALRSFVAALALRDAFVAATDRPRAFALKWPNDVLLNGGKVAGILLESLGGRGRVQGLVIGFGVNLAAAPGRSDVEPGAVPPVGLAAELGVAIAPEAFLDLLAPAYDRRERQFASCGFAPIRDAWLESAARLGAVMTARTGKAETTGVFRGVDMAGNLILDTAKGRAAVAAADVFF